METPMPGKDQPVRGSGIPIALLLSCATLVAIYWTLRYGGWAIEGDATRVTISAEGVLSEGGLVNRTSYLSGYTYPTALAFLSQITGAPLPSVQLNTGFWLVVLGLVAFVCYRELLGHGAIAALAALLLLIQPDFLFYVLRSSHEKVLWLCALLLLFLLVRSYRFAHDLRQFGVFILFFYFVFWAMVSTNVFLASTFLVALGFSFAGGTILMGEMRAPQRVLRDDSGLPHRLFMISLAGFILVFIFITYTYEPAYQYFYMLKDLVDRLSALALGAQPVDPYGYTWAAWRDPIIFLFLTMVQWLITISSAIAWITQGVRIAGRQAKRPTAGENLLWLMYAGFSVQLLMSIVVDFAGFLSANLQMRLFTPFTIISSPLAARLWGQVHYKLHSQLKRKFAWAAAGVVALGICTSLLKITHDPGIGNYWIFYSPAELKATQWADQYVRYGRIWTDIWSHQRDVLAFWQGYAWSSTNTYEFGRRVNPASYIMSSHLTRLEASRLEISLPSTVNHNRVYDNGETQLYHRRPRTPYQR
jgi:hypothetical protein